MKARGEATIDGYFLSLQGRHYEMEHLILHIFGNCHNEWQVVMAPLMEAMPFIQPWFTTLKERLLG